MATARRMETGTAIAYNLSRPLFFSEAKNLEIDFAFIFTLIGWVYEYIVSSLTAFLQATLFQSRPELASAFSNSFALLVPMTALFIILSVANAFRKLIGYILLIGWAMLIVSLFLLGG